jgi:hypothetical protein
MTGSLAGLELFHKLFDLPRAPILHTESPYYFRRADRPMSEEQFSQHCADKLEEMILAEGQEIVAAFIGEPILCTGGIVPPPAGYWQKVHAVLEQCDILLVADEVVTGFGRLGTMFGSDYYGMKPALFTIAKGPDVSLRRCPAQSSRTGCARCWSRAPTGWVRSAMAGPTPPIRFVPRPALPIWSWSMNSAWSRMRLHRRVFPLRAGKGGLGPQECRRGAR